MGNAVTKASSDVRFRTSIGSRFGDASQLNEEVRAVNVVSSMGQVRASSIHKRPVWPLSEVAQAKRARSIMVLDQGGMIRGDYRGGEAAEGLIIIPLKPYVHKDLIP